MDIDNSGRGGGARRSVLHFAFTLAVVTYLDRVCISAAAPFIMRDLDLSVVQMSFVFSAFTLAYSIFEIPTGWMGDVIGPRRVLTRIVLWWSAFTTITAAARGFVSLMAIRFLFGAGEAGAFPNISRAFARWFPPVERGKANGILFLGSRLGGALAPGLALYIIRSVLGFSALAGGFFAGLPFLLAGGADLAGGWLTDRLAAAYGLRVARCGLGFLSFAGSAVLLFASTQAADRVIKAVFISLALASADLALSASWAVCLDVGRSYAGVVTGFMNTFGNLGGFLGPLVVGFAVGRWNSWTLPFYISSAVYALGALCWLLVDPHQKLD